MVLIKFKNETNDASLVPASLFNLFIDLSIYLF
jgi:hypothetical protein